MTKSAILGMMLAVPAIANAGNDGYPPTTPPDTYHPGDTPPPPPPADGYHTGNYPYPYHYHHYADYGHTSFGVLVGTDTTFNGDPWSSRLELQLSADLGRGRAAAVSLVLPPAWMSSGQNQFGVGVTNVIEAPPSLRLRLLPWSPVRPYLDAGIGAVFVTGHRHDSQLFDTRTQQTGWMTRAVFGLEAGANHGPMLVIEPVEWRTYHLGPNYSRWGAEIGIAGRF